MVSCDRSQRRIVESSAAGVKAAASVGDTFEAASLSTFVCSNCRCAASFAEILFDYCQHCSAMPALPQGAFAACKIRAQNDSRRAPLAKEQPSQNGGAGSGKPAAAADLFPKWKLIDLSPLKYNSKFMNAIWGHYNRYSPHNIKSNDANRPAAAALAARQ